MMKKLYTYFVVIMMVVVSSCEEKAEKPLVIDEKNGLEVKISHSAGENWDPNDNFIPLPFNIATVNEDKVIVLSESIKKGADVFVKAIGAVRVTQNDTLLTYIIAIPTNEKYSSFKTTDFDEFSTVYSGAKWIVEQYLINRKDAYSVKLKSWENENFAIKYLLK